MKRKLDIAAIAAIALLFCSAPLLAQQGASSHTMAGNRRATSTYRKTSDKTFAKAAARADLTEVNLGKLAERKGTNDVVKDFGKRMVTDHSKANEQLASAASQARITIPSQPGQMEQKEYQRLSRLSGETFDRAYARLMLKAHEHDVTVFQHEAEYGKSAEIRNWAKLTLPTLEEHLKMAQQMYHTVMGGAKTKTGTGRMYFRRSNSAVQLRRNILGVDPALWLSLDWPMEETT